MGCIQDIHHGGKGVVAQAGFQRVKQNINGPGRLGLGENEIGGGNYASNAMYLSRFHCLIDVLLLPLTRVIEMKLHL